MVELAPCPVVEILRLLGNSGGGETLAEIGRIGRPVLEVLKGGPLDTVAAAVFVKLNNILNNDYLRWYQYPVQKINVMAGIGFSF